MAPKDSKAPMIAVPTEPPEMIARRGKILAELEKQLKTASGNIKACMLKSTQVLKAMEPSMPLDERLYQDFVEAFARLAKDPAALPPPDIFLTLVEYMQERISVLSPQFAQVAADNDIKVPAPKATEAAAAAAAAPPPAPPPPAAGPPTKAAKDGFESSSAPKKKMSLGGDDAPPPPSSSSEAKKKEELESFKTWMKNPSLGKMKG
ncbi:hypothetical protein [Hyalangium versicolor]|uniref:hypothetical protein n=1 Tax=Hyalangium versicolor TaxID=2861190 RepID=UPI001CCFDE22|nr:hypothetical protein [Hyalangium versicolor]